LFSFICQEKTGKISKNPPNFLLKKGDLDEANHLEISAKGEKQYKFGK